MKRVCTCVRACVCACVRASVRARAFVRVSRVKSATFALLFAGTQSASCFGEILVTA